VRTEDDSPDTTPLDRRIEMLTDHHDIEMLVHRLGACLDEARFEDLRSIFVEDATARTGGGYAEGIDAMIAQASRNHAADDHIQHRISDVLVDLDGDEATVRANLVVTFAPGGEAPSPRRSLGEVYRFGARRTLAGWRLTRVEITLVWQSTEAPAPVS
jgi:hypothetical protein